MAPRTPRPLRTLVSLLRAVLGLAVLLALVAGVPYGLLLVGHQPTELTGGWDLLTRQDDGTLFLVVLTLIGWAAWASFAFSVLVEIGAVVRRRSAPRLKGLGGMQSLAGTLIGAIVLLAPTAASAATATPAAAVTHSAPQSTASPQEATPPPATPGTEQMKHTVTSLTETPWDLAEEYLGSGPRWKDIAALNPGIPELASGDQYLPQGATLTLPADARPVAPATPTPDAASTASPAPAPVQAPQEKHDRAAGQPDPGAGAARPAHVTVRAGDSLWEIADKYGEGTDWPALYEANKGEDQGNGRTFTNPNLIYPGQELDLPAAGEKAPTPAGADKPAPAPEQKPADPAGNAPAPGGQHKEEAQPTSPTAPAQDPGPSRTAPPVPTTSAPASPGQESGSAHDRSAATNAPDEHALAPMALWAGAGALAAALIGTLAFRRRLQQRRLRPGRRIPMPEGRTAATEQSLRAAQHPAGFDLLDTALRSLALRLSQAGRELPVLEAVVLHESRIMLHLGQDSPPMKPFTSVAGHQNLWTCTAGSPDFADEESLQNADAPYPALVSIGWDAQGHLVLVDLEHVGVLQLAGDGDFPRHVLQAIAIELASTPVPGHIEVTAVGETVLPGLEEAAPERVARTPETADALADLAAHIGDQHRALAGAGADSLRAARMSQDAAGDWTPHIVLAADLAQGDDDTDRLFSTLAQRPHTAAAVIATTPAGTTATPWTLACRTPDETVVLPGSQLPIHLQGLSDAHFADAVELLTLAASDADHPAPAWVSAAPEDTVGEGSAVHGAGDGLPPEYADLEGEALEPTGSSSSPSDPTGASASQPDVHPATPPTAAAAPPAGPSLADILAEDPDNAPAPPTPVTTTGPAGIPAALATPRATVHVTLPAPAEKNTPRTAPAEPAADEGPAVMLLGPVRIDGATGRIDSSRKNIGIELTAYLALHPGADHHDIDSALWPGRIVKKGMRNPVITRTRSWLAHDADRQPHLPLISATGDHRYRLGPHVTCDWTRFQKHARKGLADPTEDGTLALRQALALVRGRPFTGIDPGRYAWAEPDIQEMVSAIAHVAYELSTRAREADDIPGALWAAHQGLLACEEHETLHRQLFLAHHAAGDIEALRKAAATLVKINDQLGGVDMDAETAELLRNLLPRQVRA